MYLTGTQKWVTEVCRPLPITIGAFGTCAFVVNSLGIIQNQHAKKSSLHGEKGERPALDTDGQ